MVSIRINDTVSEAHELLWCSAEYNVIIKQYTNKTSKILGFKRVERLIYLYL